MGEVKIEDINKGDILWECFQGGSYETKILTQPIHKDGKWTWRGQTDKEEGEFLVTDGLEHYGPRLFTEPVYMPHYPLNHKEAR